MSSWLQIHVSSYTIPIKVLFDEVVSQVSKLTYVQQSLERLKKHNHV